jgi:hypothetical protein
VELKRPRLCTSRGALAELLSVSGSATTISWPELGFWFVSGKSILRAVQPMKQVIDRQVIVAQ